MTFGGTQVVSIPPRFVWCGVSYYCQQQHGGMTKKSGLCQTLFIVDDDPYETVGNYPKKTTSELCGSEGCYINKTWLDSDRPRLGGMAGSSSPSIAENEFYLVNYVKLRRNEVEIRTNLLVFLKSSAFTSRATVQKNTEQIHFVQKITKRPLYTYMGSHVCQHLYLYIEWNLTCSFNRGDGDGRPTLAPNRPRLVPSFPLRAKPSRVSPVLVPVLIQSP